MDLLTFFLVLILPTSYGLLCIKQETPFKQLLLDFNYKKFEKSFNKLYTTQRRSRCRLWLYIDSENTFLYILFSKLTSHTDIDDNQVRLDTFVNSFLPGQKHLRYACSDQDTCDMKFVLAHVQWFVQGKYLDLQHAFYHLLPIIVNESKQCLKNNDESQYKLCENATCQIVELDTGKQKCIVDTPLLYEIHIHNNFNTLEHHEEQHIMFYDKCENCFSLENFQYLHEYIRQYYDLSPIRIILGYENQSYQQEQIIDTSPYVSSRISSTKTTSTSTIRNTSFSSTISTNNSFRKNSEFFCFSSVFFVEILKRCFFAMN